MLLPSYAVIACNPSRARTPNIDAGMSRARTGNDNGRYILESGSFSLGGRSMDASSSASLTDSCSARIEPISLRCRLMLLRRILILLDVLRRLRGIGGLSSASDRESVRLEFLSELLPVLLLPDATAAFSLSPAVVYVVRGTSRIASKWGMKRGQE